MSKNNFSKLVNAQGFFHPEAKKYLDEMIGKEIRMLLSYAKTENELRILGSAVSAMVGDAVTNRVQEIK